MDLRDGDPAAVPFPRGMMHSKDLEFSFSGLKTAVWKHAQENGVPEGQAMNDLCASLQEAIVEVLVAKTRKAVTQTGVNRVVLTGGVAANSRLRACMEAAATADGWTLLSAERRWCTDNAAMIGYVAGLRFRRGERSPLSVDADPGLQLATR